MLFRICVACDHTNPPDSRFCGKCGAPLQVRFCRLCRSANDSIAHFCQTCGTQLPEIAAPESASRPSAVAEAEETGEAFVIGTPGRPVAELGGAARPPASATITTAFPGTEPQPAGSPAGRETDSPDGESPVRIELLPPQAAAAPPIIVEGAPAASNLAVLVPDSGPAQRRHRLAPAVLTVLLVVIVGALGALTFNIWRPTTAADAQHSATDRADASAGNAGSTTSAATLAPAAPASQGAAAIGAIETRPVALPPSNADAAPAPRKAAAPESGETKSNSRERRDAAPRSLDRAAVLPPALPPVMTPRECSDAIAALGLCTPPPRTEGK